MDDNYIGQLITLCCVISWLSIYNIFIREIESSWELNSDFITGEARMGWYPGHVIVSNDFKRITTISPDLLPYTPVMLHFLPAIQ